MTLRPDSGSFRDPLSRVFVADDHVWRALAPAGLEDYRAVAESPFFAAAMERGDIIGTELVDAPPAELGDDWAAVLRHERLDVVTYPYEWSFEMLRDAARLQLDLTREALAEKIITKDASAYNVQFRGARPVFIDVGSFERLRPEPWPGYRQFCELFLNPLLIQAVADVDFRPLLRGSVHGIPPTETAALLGGRGKLTKGVLTHVKLHARAEERYADADRERDVKQELQRAGFGPGIIDAQLKNLRKAIDGLKWDHGRSTWSEYSDRSHYTDRDLDAKDDFVRATIGAATDRHLVLDLGANDGRFSRAALAAGAERVVAVDSDHLVIDRLYRTLREEGEDRILPLVVDLSDPSPAMGWRGRERPAFVDRVRPDVVLCLAVVHHLALTNTVPLPEIVEFLADFGAPLVVEFPHRDDEMASRLLARKRAGVFDAYDRPQWEAALERRFHVRRRATLPGGTRTLYDAVPR